jgi:hypothetical protein
MSGTNVEKSRFIGSLAIRSLVSPHPALRGAFSANEAMLVEGLIV